MNKVRIIQNKCKSEVFIDDVKICACRYVEFRASVDEVPIVNLEFTPEETEITVEEAEDNGR